MAKTNVQKVALKKPKVQKKNKGVHSKNNPPEKKYRGQGR